MKVLGIVGSYRRFGNTEVAVKEALLGAKEAGAQIEWIRLTDYKIEPCTGCMRCVFKKAPCPIEDDAHIVLEKIERCDALVLGVPDYILGTAGILKMVLDRAMRLMYSDSEPKPAVAIVPYGVEGWEGLAKAQAATFLLALRFKVLDIFMPRCQGPGEILLNPEHIDRCHEMGRRLVRGEETGSEGICPVCKSSILEITGLSVRCPICNIHGHIIVEDGRLGVKFQNPENHRWQPENIKLHFEKAVLPSGERYLKERPLIKEKLSRYRW